LSVIAPDGQILAHLPQEIHFSGLTNLAMLLDSIHLAGHTSTHFPHAVHLSSSIKGKATSSTCLPTGGRIYSNIRKVKHPGVKKVLTP